MKTSVASGLLILLVSSACHPRVSASGSRGAPPPPPPSTPAPPEAARARAPDPAVGDATPITVAAPPVTTAAPGALGVVTCEVLAAANLGTPPGALLREDIRSAMDAATYTFSQCYGRSLRLPGASEFTKMVATFVIGGDGRVLAACPRITSGSATLDQCVLYHVTRVQFPPPAKAGRVVVNYPFTFRLD